MAIMLQSRRTTTTTNKNKKKKKFNVLTCLLFFLIFVLGIIICYGYFMLHHFDSTRTSSSWSSSSVASLADTFTIPRNHMPQQQQQQQQQQLIVTNSTNLRYLTIVMPSVVNPTKRKNRLEAIDETWGPSSHAIYIVHNAETEYPKASVIPNNHTTTANTQKYYQSRIYSKNKKDLVFPMILLLPPTIDSETMGVKRLYYILRQVWIEFMNPVHDIDPKKRVDFLFLVNDHTFVIPEHLCHYLRDKDPNQDMYHGHALKSDALAFNSGAAGYILSKRTIQRLLELWDTTNRMEDTATIKQTTNEKCFFPPNPLETDQQVLDSITMTSSSVSASKWFQGNPGVVLALCLKDPLHITAIDTRQDHKFHRFHAYGLLRTVFGRFDPWYLNKHVGLVEDAVEQHKIEFETDASYGSLIIGSHCCSAESIAFHYVEEKENLALWELRKKLILHPLMNDETLQTNILSLWPATNADVGGYSILLPAKENADLWANLLRVIRNISLRKFQQC